MGAPTAETGTQRWDGLKEAIQEYRERVGNPSYEEMARRVAEERQRNGADPFAARVARSTVYEVLRPGKPRPNLGLLKEISLALGAGPELVDEWFERCTRPAPDVEVAEPEAPVETRAEEVAPIQGWQAATLILVAVGINLLGRLFTDGLDLPIYLDMVGTAIAAIALGPWRGALVGLLTNYLGHVMDPDASLMFALVNVTGALAWGYGVRRFALGRTIARFFLLNLGVAALCSLVAVPIVLSLLGDELRFGHDAIVANFQNLGYSIQASVGFGNLTTSTADKLLSGFVALVCIAFLSRKFQNALPIAQPRD
ncbi:ECF transporter S component [Nocardioides sp.]|uniref:ECF transporter S component n=1 Tax=Nocardioides sp. TaxID=35761 RepID=UPI002619FC89|nr:ECF transporter S component [Nocardioides sp.]